MDVDPFSLDTFQPTLFETSEAEVQDVELFPAVWRAAELLVSADLAARVRGFEQLEALGAARISPLVTYLLATRINDPDVAFRVRVIKTLSDLLVPDTKHSTPEGVRRYLANFMKERRQRSLFNLMEASIFDATVDASIARLLNLSSFAGRHLADLMMERKFPYSIRQKAIYFISLVGYLDAIPMLERLESRLEARQNGQQTMSFALLGGPDESELLPAIHQTLISLRAP